MYRATRYFIDLKDGGHSYQKGDAFPFDGKEIPSERLEELSSDQNRLGCPLIELVPEEKKAKKRTAKK